MARGGRGSASTTTRSSGFGRSSSSSSAPAPAPARSAPSAASKPQQQAPPQQAPPMQPSSGGSGFLGTLAASAAGSMVGNVVANKLFGGGNNGEQALPQTQRALDDELGPCAAPFKNFLKCVEQNPENVGSCQWGYSMYSQCRQQNGQQQM